MSSKTILLIVLVLVIGGAIIYLESQKAGPTSSDTSLENDANTQAAIGFPDSIQNEDVSPSNYVINETVKKRIH
ncbi:MAG: hypothetical protein Q7S65_01200, partial [Nanoarchaeota archaeon]|nr:hypothetical protein [Nanoarchaeota archaeon]